MPGKDQSSARERIKKITTRFLMTKTTVTLQENLFILAFIFLLSACNQNNSTTNNKLSKDTINKTAFIDTIKKNKKQLKRKRLSFQNVNEIIADSSAGTWVKLNGDTASLALHFEYKDTLAVSYSPECWLMYPYKVDSNKIVVYWDNNIDTKYNFDIVKAINQTDRKLIGKPFMILELENDTTLKASYPMKKLIKKINSSSKERVFFPGKYMVSQDNYLF
jgi:hypothetical protein